MFTYFSTATPLFDPQEPLEGQQDKQDDHSQFINPFTAQACKNSGLNDTRTNLQTVYFPVL